MEKLKNCDYICQTFLLYSVADLDYLAILIFCPKKVSIYLVITLYLYIILIAD